MKRKSIIACIIVFGATTSVGQADEQSMKVPISLQHKTEVRFYGEGELVKKDMKEAIEDGLIVTQTYKVQPDDTLSKIFAKQGLQADANSVEIVNAMNGYSLAPNKLAPGQNIWILSKGDIAQVPAYKSWDLIVDADKKALLDEAYMELRNLKPEIAKWAAHTGPSLESAVAVDNYRQIMDDMGDLRVTWYAMDSASLDGLHNAVTDVKAKFRAASLDVSWRPSEKDIRLLAVIRDEIANQVQFARNYDRARVPVEVVTRSATSGEELANLSVCYRIAMDYHRHRIENPGTEPDWDCLYSFSTLSSPAKIAFKHNAGFAVWAERDDERISGYHILRVEPNQADGRFVKEVSVAGPGQ